MQKTLQIVLLILSFNFATSQNRKLDSLQTRLKTANHDTTRYSVYIGLSHFFRNSNADTAIYFLDKAGEIAERMPVPLGDLRKGEAIRQTGWIFYLKSDYPQALKLYNQTIAIAQKYLQEQGKDILTKAKKLQAAALGNIGVVYLAQSDYPKALDFYFRALKINEEIGYKRGQATVIGNIGVIYHEQSDYPKALDYFFKALKIDEEAGDKKSQASNLNNIGLVYADQSNYPKALDYYNRALKINEEIGNKQNEANNLGNIAIAFMNQSDYPKALDYYFRALKICEEIGNKRGQANNLGNIGLVYSDQSDHHKALDYYFSALKINEETGNKYYQAANFENIGSAYTSLKQFAKAENYLKQAEKIGRELGTIDILKNNCLELSKLYEQTGRDMEALAYYKEFVTLRDSIYNVENTKKSMQKEIQFNYEKKAAADSVKVAEEKKVVAAQLKQEKTQRFALYGGLVLIAVFALFMFNRFRVSQKQNTIIAQQKHVIEEKHKEVTDSIRYAKRIQSSLLPSDKYIVKAIKKN